MYTLGDSFKILLITLGVIFVVTNTAIVYFDMVDKYVAPKPFIKAISAVTCVAIIGIFFMLAAA